MRRTTLTATALGTLAGAMLGLLAAAFAASRTIDSGLVLVDGLGAAFAVTRNSADLFAAFAGAAAGALVAALSYATARLADPRERRYPPGRLVVAGTLSGSFLAYATARAGFGATAEHVVDRVMTVGVIRALIVALIAGAVTGGVVAAGTERLARPSVYAFGGEAWPADTRAFLREAGGALGLPMVGVAGAAAAVYGLSRVLLASSHLVALVVFAGAAAVVLFGAAAIAARQPKGRG